ncbi:hypothetical protein T03_1336, partial [Trichinella britovi]
MIHEKLRAGFRCRLLSSKTQILSPGRKSWLLLMVECMGIYSAALCMLTGSDDFCRIK